MIAYKLVTAAATEHGEYLDAFLGYNKSGNIEVVLPKRAFEGAKASYSIKSCDLVVAVAVAAGKVIGWAGWHQLRGLTDQSWSEHGVWVKRSWRRRGVARGLWQLLADHCNPRRLIVGCVSSRGYSFVLTMQQELEFEMHISRGGERDLRKPKKRRAA